MDGDPLPLEGTLYVGDEGKMLGHVILDDARQEGRPGPVGEVHLGEAGDAPPFRVQAHLEGAVDLYPRDGLRGTGVVADDDHDRAAVGAAPLRLGE